MIRSVLGTNLLRGHDHSPQRTAEVEGIVRYHHQRRGQGQVGQCIIIYEEMLLATMIYTINKHISNFLLANANGPMKVTDLVRIESVLTIIIENIKFAVSYVVMITAFRLFPQVDR